MPWNGVKPFTRFWLGDLWKCLFARNDKKREKWFEKLREWPIVPCGSNGVTDALVTVGMIGAVLVPSPIRALAVSGTAKALYSALDTLGVRLLADWFFSQTGVRISNMADLSGQAWEFTVFSLGCIGGA